MPVRFKISDEPIEVRPTLIVGLGGTGTLACQWAYHIMYELFGEVPPFVRFLCLDTDAQEESKARRLPRSDFVNLYNELNLASVLREYQLHREDYPHLDWLGDLPLDPSLVGSGCQGVTRLGRAVFFQLREDVIAEEMHRRLRELASTDIHQQLERFDPKDQYVLQPNSMPIIHVCSSLCGGTGTGLLLDLAYNARRWSEEATGRPADVVGHLLLPEAFALPHDTIRDKLRAVAGTLLEAIEVLSDGRRRPLQLRYRNGEIITIEPVTAPFDLVYLVSGTSPAGTDTRDTLTQMMGRMLCTLSVEPAGKVILSDANNKQHDILSRHDPLNGRRTMFAAYGLQLGTVSAQLADREPDDVVLEWIYESLRSLENAGGLLNEQFAAELNQMIDRRIRLEQFTRAIPSEDWREWRAPQTARNHESALREHVRKVVVEQAFEGIRKRVQEALSAECAQLREELIDLGLRAVRTMGPAALPGLLNRALQRIAARREQAYLEAGQPITWAEQLLQRIRDRGVKPQDIMGVNDAAKEAWSELWESLVTDAANTVLSEELRKLEDDLRKQIDGLGQLAAHAHTADNQPRASTTRVRIEGFEMPLVRLLHPITAYERDDGKHPRIKVIRDRFLEELVTPVLQSALKTGRWDRTALQQLLHSLRENGPLYREFYQDYEKQYVAMFHEKDVDRPEEHPLFSRLLDLMQTSVAKVLYNSAGKFVSPLETLLAQHQQNSCVAAILRNLVGRNVRFAYVSSDYEQRTRTLVELIHIVYGISLPALSTYRSYVEARKRHLAGSRFEERHLWPCDEWHEEFEHFLQTVEEEVRQTRPAEVDGRRLRRQTKSPMTLAIFLEDEHLRDLEELCDGVLKRCEEEDLEDAVADDLVVAARRVRRTIRRLETATEPERRRLKQDLQDVVAELEQVLRDARLLDDVLAPYRRRIETEANQQ